MAAHPNNAPALGGHRLLVVEDEFLVARHLCSLIRELGGEAVGPAPDVATAREHLAAGGVDAALLDVKLGESAVFPLADDLAARGIAFVFVSGYGRGHLPERFADRPLLEKPVKESTLGRVLAQALQLGDARSV
jgi:CheY-like chemotaxis protein